MESLQEIEQLLDDKVSEVFDNPSSSKHADWRLWRSIFASALWFFVQIMNRNKQEVESLTETGRAGNIEWYNSELRKFQGETIAGTFIMDELLVDNSGIVKFANEDEGRRLIAYMSLTESSEGVLHIKAAKTDKSKAARLTDSERIAFSSYIKMIKYPGLKWVLTADNPDIIRYDMTIYHDSTTPDDVYNAVLKLIEGYQNTLGFDDKFYTQRFVEYIRKSADEVITIKLNSLQAKAAVESEFKNVDVMYELVAGYFNYQPEDSDSLPSNITMKHIDELVL